MRFGRLGIIGALLVVAFGAGVQAQTQFPPPAGPVTICGAQATPNADSYQLVFDGAAPEAVTITSASSGCPTGATHSFTLPANRFVVGQHTLKIIAINAFGSTEGPTYTVTVGIAPGAFTITAVQTGD